MRPGPDPPGFEVPTSEELLLAVLDGEAAVRPYRAMFAAAAPYDHVRSLLVQAIDPLLLRIALGAEQAKRWVPLLERYYAQARRRSPATFLDFERAWRDQRRRWQPLVDADASAGAAQQAAVAPDTAHDVPGRGVDPEAAAAARRRRRPAAPPPPPLPSLPPGSLPSVHAPAVAISTSSADVAVPGAPGASSRAPDPASVRPASATGDKGTVLLEAAYQSYYDLLQVFDPWRPADWAQLRVGSRALSRDAGERRR